MEWQKLLDPEIQEFMHVHAGGDVRALALKKPPKSDWPYMLILDQIKVRQKARMKSPDLYDTDSFIFPSSDLFEQASSSPCAIFKASLVEGGRFVDLTAGSGIDAFAFSKRFKQGILVEQNIIDYQILSHNCEALGLTPRVKAINADSHDYIEEMPQVDLVYIDPQRRDAGRKGIYDLSSCSPDITALLPLLQQKAKRVLLKASPVLDIDKAIETLRFVKQVFVVGWGGDCKEVLYLMDMREPTDPDAVQVNAVELDDAGVPIKKFTYVLGEEAIAPVQYAMPQDYIYEPGAAFLKAGGFKSIAAQYQMNKLHPSTHLYTSARMQDSFCGKCYKVVDIVSPRADQMSVKSAELVLRNFPGDISALRKKLKLSEGDRFRVFATTLADNSKKMIICEKF